MPTLPGNQQPNQPVASSWLNLVLNYARTLLPNRASKAGQIQYSTGGSESGENTAQLDPPAAWEGRVDHERDRGPGVRRIPVSG